MRQADDNFPHPVSDPESDGLPEYADDDSTAYDEVPSGRIADGPDPAPLPADHAVAVDRYGTTAEEARQGESLDYKLAREYAAAGDSAAGDRAATDDEGDALSEDVDQVHGAFADIAPEDYDPHSKVSMYDRPDPDEPGRPVGRLVEPDEGVREDDESHAVAYDAGAAGGGPTAEEAAMHEFRAP
jgi:hypothetical protein